MAKGTKRCSTVKTVGMTKRTVNKLLAKHLERSLAGKARFRQNYRDATGDNWDLAETAEKKRYLRSIGLTPLQEGSGGKQPRKKPERRFESQAKGLANSITKAKMRSRVYSLSGFTNKLVGEKQRSGGGRRKGKRSVKTEVKRERPAVPPRPAQQFGPPPPVPMKPRSAPIEPEEEMPPFGSPIEIEPRDVSSFQGFTRRRRAGGAATREFGESDANRKMKSQMSLRSRRK